MRHDYEKKEGIMMNIQYLVALIINAIPYLVLQTCSNDNYLSSLFDASILVIALIYFYNKMQTNTNRIIYIIGCVIVNICSYFMFSNMIFYIRPEYKGQELFSIGLLTIFAAGLYAILSFVVSIGVCKIIKQK